MENNTPAGAAPTAAAVVLACAAQAATRPLAGFGPGAVAGECARIGGGYPAGVAGGAGKASGGYALGFADAIRIPKVRRSAVQSTVQHNTMTLPIPVTRGGVGPHPWREHPPA